MAMYTLHSSHQGAESVSPPLESELDNKACFGQWDVEKHGVRKAAGDPSTII